jgi:hypothetical protein
MSLLPRRRPAKKQAAPEVSSEQCTITTIKGKRCALPAIEKGMCRLHRSLLAEA